MMNGNNKVLNYNEELKKLTNYFNVENVSQIAWAHAVNNKTYLQQCLTDSPQTMMLEADILVSLKTNSIIMAHPKLKENNGQEFWDFNVESDLTFEEFVTSIDTFNFNAKYKKGMKLDFKQPSVVKPCLESLRALEKEGKLKGTPVWLNADVFPGPGGRQPLFDAVTFIKECQDYFPRGWLSLGYTVTKTAKSGYTKEMIDSLIQHTRECTGPITVAVAVHFVRDSWKEWCRLLEQSEKYTLTLWCWSPIDKELRTWLQNYTNPQRTFLDLVYDN